MGRMLMALTTGAAVLVALTSAWYVGRPLEPLPAPPVTVRAQSASTVVDRLTVYVSGEVAQPGLVSVPTGSRVADAISAAGGATERAVLSALNLASLVSDGQQIIVPDRAGSPGTDSAAVAGPNDGLVHINVATAEDLENLPGVGPVLAARIVEYRNKHGLFASVEDLLDVPGIGEGKLATLRDSVAIP